MGSSDLPAVAVQAPGPRDGTAPVAEPAHLPDAGLHLRLSGPPAFCMADGSLQPLARKDAALLALLAWDGPQPPEHLAALLWPDADAAKGRNNLRQRLFRLRREAGLDWLAAATPGLLTLAPAVRHDLAEPAADAGTLLGALDYGDTAALDDWVRSARAAWDRRRLDAWAGLAARHEAAGQLAAALQVAGHIVALAPLQEHGWRRLMRLHYQRGDRAAAIAAFEAMERQLRDELGSRPADETTALLAQIESAQPQPVAPMAPGRGPLPAVLLRPPRLVGRDAALAAVSTAWASGAPFMLVGVAGRGKTRLLQHAVGDPDPAHPRRVLWLQGRPGDERSPYALTSRLLGHLAARLGPAAADGEAPALPSALPGMSAYDRAELARLHPAFGHAPTQAGHQSALWSAVERALALACSQGLAVVVVDDLQFSDDASVELLRWLAAADALHGLRWALATRQVPASGPLADWAADSHRPVPVPLLPLALPDVEALLHSLQLPQAPSTLAATLLGHAGGEPFHLLETLKDLVLHGPTADPGAAKDHANRSGVDHDRAGPADSVTPAAQGTPATARLPRPASVTTLLQRRLAALPTDAQSLLRVAAVAGVDFSVALAARLLGRSPWQLADAWALLEAQGVLHGAAWQHDLMRDAALATVPAALLAPLHAAVAEALADQPEVPAARRAEHWQAAGRWRDAGEAWFSAGNHAHRAGRLTEHVALLARAAQAFEQAGDTGRRIDALSRRLDGELVLHGGQTVVDQVRLLLPQAVTRRQQAELLQVECEALLNLARFDAVVDRSRALLAASEGLDDLLPDSLSLCGRALAGVGRRPEAMTLLRQALAGAEALHAAGASAAPLARAIGHLGNALYLDPADLPEALQCTRRAAAMAQALGDPADHAIHLTNLATMLNQCGDVAGAGAAAAEADAAYRRLLSSDGDAALINELSIAMADLHLGRLADALARLQSVLARLTPASPAAAVAKARLLLAELLELLGQAHQAEALLADASACRAAELPPSFAALRLFALARLQPWQGAVHRAAAMALCAAMPDLAPSPALLRDWAQHADPAEVLPVLDRIGERARVSHGEGLLRSVQLMRLTLLARTAGQAGNRLSADQRALATTQARALAASPAGPWHSATPVWWAAQQLQAWLGGRRTTSATACARVFDAWFDAAGQGLDDTHRAGLADTQATAAALTSQVRGGHRPERRAPTRQPHGSGR